MFEYARLYILSGAHCTLREKNDARKESQKNSIEIILYYYFRRYDDQQQYDTSTRNFTSRRIQSESQGIHKLKLCLRFDSRLHLESEQKFP